jgi:hypothetical protein
VTDFLTGLVLGSFGGASLTGLLMERYITRELLPLLRRANDQAESWRARADPADWWKGEPEDLP